MLSFCDTITLDSFHAIQPHGVLLILNSEFKIIQYSENISDILEISIDQLLANSIFNFLIPLDNTVDVKVMLAHENDVYKKMIWRTKNGDIQILIHLHQYPKQIILEIERNTEHLEVFDDLGGLTESVMAIMNNPGRTLKELAQTTCKNILKITDYDRVILYKFDPLDHSGVVIGEARKKGMESYQGLHFPANDIPLPAREMYLKLKLRYIPTILANPVKMIPTVNLITNDPLDISGLNLRMVAPVHVKYVKNMGLISSTSVAILKNNTLWGIIACHNKSAKYLSLNLRMFLLISANTLSMQISTLEFKEIYEEEAKAADIQTNLAFKFNIAGNVKEALDKHHEEIMEITKTTGLSLYFQGDLFHYGETPNDEQLFKLIKWLQCNKKANTYVTSNLPAEYESSELYKDIACGLLAIKSNSVDDHYLLFYKPELVKTLQWAGNPNEEISFDNLKDYSPRNSFKKYLTKITDQSRKWTRQEIKTAEFISFIMVSKQLQMSLQYSSAHDTLTNLYNRSSLEKILSQEINRATRESRALTIFLIDIDYFKNINDTFGHLTGDEVLVALSKLLSASFRGYDYIFRYGGEEFLIILPDVDCKKAKKKADFIRNKTKQLQVLFNGSVLPPITISIGICILSDHCADTTSLIALADAALYQAKANGRDQYVVLEKLSGT